MACVRGIQSLTNPKGFSLVSILVASAIGAIFVGVSFEIFKVSYRSLEISQITAAKQDLEIEVEKFLKGTEEEENNTQPDRRTFCAKNLNPNNTDDNGTPSDTSDDFKTNDIDPAVANDWKKVPINISLLRRGSVKIRPLDEIGILTIKGISLEGDPSKDNPSGEVIRELVVEYSIKEDPTTHKLKCKINYEFDGTNVNVCKLIGGCSYAG